MRARVPGRARGLTLRRWLATLALGLACAAGAEDAAPPAADVVVLIHGLGRSERAMWPLERRLAAAGYAVHTLDYASTEQPPDALVAQLDADLARCCAGAARLHFVTHSLGGVLLRALLAPAAEPAPAPAWRAGLGRVVMLAPPNHGSELADWLQGSRTLSALLGPTATQLGTGAGSLPNRLPPADFEVGVIAGNGSWNPLGSRLIPGEDDGTVSVESTRLDGMRDFLLLPVSHTRLLTSREAAAQALAFLRGGRFDHEALE